MICPKCGGSLLAREGILQAGRKYHRKCWTCAQCSVPLTTPVRKQTNTNEYLCQTCHIQRNGLREGMIVAMWKKNNQQVLSSMDRQRTTLNDNILLL